MTKDLKIRWNWLKGMYLYTLIGAGGLGSGILLKPDVVPAKLGWSVQDPIALGIIASVLLAFALLSILGLRSPLKFAPVLLLQLCYKTIWFIAVILPLFVTGRLPKQAMILVMIYLTFIIGDLIAIPFSYVFMKQAE